MRLGERPIGAAILGALCIAFSAILVRLAESEPSTVAVFRCAWAVPVLWFLARREQRRFGAPDPGVRRLAIVAGIFFALDLIAWHHSIEGVGAGLATVLGNLQVVMVGFAAWIVLGERPDRRLLVAVPVVLGGVVLISGVVGQGAYGDDPVLGVVFGVLTAIFYTAFILILRHAGADVRRPAGPLYWATASSAITALLLGIPLGELDLTPGWEATAWLVTLALTSQVLGWMLISVSLPRLPAALTSVLLMVQPVGSVLLGVILLSEAPSSYQVVGVAIVLSGILIATLGRRKPPVAEPAG